MEYWNGYFADFLGISVSRVSHIISDLEKKDISESGKLMLMGEILEQYNTWG